MDSDTTSGASPAAGESETPAAPASDAHLAELMYRVAYLVDGGSVDRFVGDALFAATLHLQDSLEPVLRYASRVRPVDAES